VTTLATMSHDPSQAISKGRQRPRVLVPEMWASLAISVIWLAVLIEALFGPNLVFNSAGGASSTTIPSAVVLVLFAYLATRAIAKHGFDRRRDDG
jgi:hypothetical protein